MNVELDTRTRVIALAYEQLASGVKPSQQSIRAQLETGSNATIGSALKEFWERLGQDVEAMRSKPDVPDEVFDVATKLWDRALEHGIAQADERMQAAYQLEAESEAKVAEIKEELRELRQQNAAYEVTRLANQGRINDLTTRVEVLERENADLKNDAASAWGDLYASREETSAVREKLEAKLDRAEERYLALEEKYESLRDKYDALLHAKLDERDSKKQSFKDDLNDTDW